MLHSTFHWALVIVPGIAVLVALVAAYIASRPGEFHGFDDLGAQLQADAHALRVVGEQHHDR